MLVIKGTGLEPFAIKIEVNGEEKTLTRSSSQEDLYLALTQVVKDIVRNKNSIINVK